MAVNVEETPKRFIKKVFAELKANEQSVRNSSAKERLSWLKKLKAEILLREREIKAAIYADYERSPVETELAEIWVIIKEINFAMRHLPGWMRPKRVPTPITFLGSSSAIYYEAKGTSLIISPWNFPFNLSFAPLVSAIAAGNPVVLKPSEKTPHSAQLIEKIVTAVFPSNVVRVVQGGPEFSTELLRLKFSHIFFTGSPKIGRIVMEAAAKHLTSVTLELGGKTPVIIDEHANLKDAARKTVFAKMVNNGQVCLAADYVFVHQHVAKQFNKLLRKEMNRMFPAIGLVDNPDYARIATTRQFKTMQSFIADAIEKGASVPENLSLKAEERFVSPVIINNVSSEMRVDQEEIFGPILPIKTFVSVNEVIDSINQGFKPLVMYIFSKNDKFKKSLLKHTSSGAAVMNDVYIHHFNSHLPFGGVNNSGIGKSHGYFGFLEFSNQRAVVNQWFPISTSTVLQPPYTKWKKRLVKGIVNLFS